MQNSSGPIIPVVIQQFLGDCVTLLGEQIARGGIRLLASPEADRDGVTLVWKEIQDAVATGCVGRRTRLILLAVVTTRTDMIRVFALGGPSLISIHSRESREVGSSVSCCKCCQENKSP